MGYSSSLTLLAICLAVAHASSIYGVSTMIGGNYTECIVETVQVDMKTGNFTLIARNFIYVGDSITFDGISALDQKNNRLYYSADWESQFIFSVNVLTGELLAPISVSSEAVWGLTYDPIKAQLLVLAAFSNASVAIITIPDIGGATMLVNFTDAGITEISADALDSINGIYYVAYSLPNQLKLASFELANPTQITNAAFPCGNKLLPNYLVFDNKLNKLVGNAIDLSNDETYYFEIVGGKCTTVVYNTLAKQVITCSTYDPTTSSLYLATSSFQIYNFSTVTHTFGATVSIPNALDDMEVFFM